jgi:hypothetical protein
MRKCDILSDSSDGPFIVDGQLKSGFKIARLPWRPNFPFSSEKEKQSATAEQRELLDAMQLS